MLNRLAPAAVIIALTGGMASAQAPVTPGQPPQQVLPPVNPGTAPAPAPAAPVPAPAPGQTSTAPTAPQTRTFTAPTGLLFNTVRPERVKDFETVMYYLTEALKTSTNPTVRAQAQGWRVLKASEPGPNGTVLYVFVLDPAVTGADYGLGRILVDAYPAEKVQEIWRLYQGSVTSGGSLLNLTPVAPEAPAAPPVPAVDPAPAPAPRTAPPGSGIR
jgi:hypothetical protein